MTALDRQFSVEGPPLFYFAEPVQVVEDLGGGWVLAEWCDGRRWRHWRDQIRIAPTTKPKPVVAVEHESPQRRGTFEFNDVFYARLCVVLGAFVGATAYALGGVYATVGVMAVMLGAAFVWAYVDGGRS